jgi:hypothetical protein
LGHEHVSSARGYNKFLRLSCNGRIEKSIKEGQDPIKTAEASGKKDVIVYFIVWSNDLMIILKVYERG